METGLIVIIGVWILFTITALGITYLTYQPENVGNYFSIDIKSEDGTYKKSEAGWRPALLFADIVIAVNTILVPTLLITTYKNYVNMHPKKIKI